MYGRFLARITHCKVLGYVCLLSKKLPKFLVKRAGKNVTNYQAFTRKMKKKNRARKLKRSCGVSSCLHKEAMI